MIIKLNIHYTTNKGTATHSTHLLHIAKDYVQYKERTSPFIVSPRMPPAVRWAAGTDRQRIFLHVAVVQYFYERSFTLLFAKYALKRREQPRCCRNRIARPVQNGNCYSSLAQRVRDTTLYITGTGIKTTYILLWEHCLVIHCYRVVTMIIPGT